MRTHGDTAVAKDLVLMRYTDANKNRLAVLCRPKEGVETLRDIIGEVTEEDSEWFNQPHESAIVLDTTGTITITSSDDIANLCLWFAMASQWLRTHGG